MLDVDKLIDDLMEAMLNYEVTYTQALVLSTFVKLYSLELAETARLESIIDVE